jgi:hypothetical protein
LTGYLVCVKLVTPDGWFNSYRNELGYFAKVIQDPDGAGVLRYLRAVGHNISRYPNCG